MFALKSIVLLSVVAFSFAKLEISDEMRQIAQTCQEEFVPGVLVKDILGVDSVVIADNQKCFIKCAFTKIGMISGGVLNHDVFDRIMKAYSDDETAIATAGDYCFEHYADLSSCSTVFEFKKCLTKKLLELDPTAFHP